MKTPKAGSCLCQLPLSLCADVPPPSEKFFFSGGGVGGRLYTGYSLLTNQLSIGWTLFKLATWRCLPKVSISKRELNPDPRPYSVLFAIQDGVFGRVACSLEKYKALTPPPQSLPLFPPLPDWTLLHLGPPLLVLSSLRAWSIDQFFVQKQKLKIDRNIQFLILFP